MGGGWRVSNTASITNRQAFMVGGSGLGIGQTPSATRAIQINANGLGKNRHRIYCTNQLGNIGGGRRNSQFGSTADGARCGIGGAIGHSPILVVEYSISIPVTGPGGFQDSSQITVTVHQIGSNYYATVTWPASAAQALQGTWPLPGVYHVKPAIAQDVGLLWWVAMDDTQIFKCPSYWTDTLGGTISVTIGAAAYQRADDVAAESNLICSV